jgi:GT2 family glycosyltransferase
MVDEPASDRGTERPDVTVVVVNYNTAHLLKPMFDALEASRSHLRMEIVVIDNASRDTSVAVLRDNYPDVTLIENAVNVGFGRANNQAIPLIRGRYVLLLNTDAFVSADTLTKTISFMDENPGFGVLGVKLVGTDGLLQPSCRYFPTPWNVFLAANGLTSLFPSTRLVDDMAWDHAAVRECDWVPGCYYLIRREAIDRAGLFDPRFFMYYEEVDHCRAVKQAGWSVVYYPFTQVVHLGGESAATDSPLGAGRQITSIQIESELLYFRKRHGIGGLIAVVVLTTAGDIAKAFKRIIMHGDAANAANAMRHALRVLRNVATTHLATRATR